MAKLKATKSMVNYSKGMATRHCSICRHWQPPSSCTEVAGKIKPSYWCKLFLAAKN